MRSSRAPTLQDKKDQLRWKKFRCFVVKGIARHATWELTHGTSFPGKLIPIGAKVIFKPAETKQEGTSKMEPSAITGIYAGYELNPGCRWSGIYMVWSLDDFVDIGLLTKGSTLSRKMRRPHKNRSH